MKIKLPLELCVFTILILSQSNRKCPLLYVMYIYFDTLIRIQDFSGKTQPKHFLILKVDECTNKII